MTTEREILYLSRRDVASVGLTMAECNDILEQAHRTKAAGDAEMPAKPCLGDPLGDGFLYAYTARVGADRIGMKWLGGRPDNKKYGVPQLNALIVINDPKTLLPVAIMDGTEITGLRTAGVSGIAMRHLARKDSRTLAILGCGFQGETHLRAALAVCGGLERVYAWSPNLASAQRFAQKMGPQVPVEIRATADAEAAVRAADVIVSSTPQGDPAHFAILHAPWFREGATAISISLANHFYPDAFFSFDRYYVDDHATMRLLAARPGLAGCAHTEAEELGEMLLRGGGRTDERQRILVVCEGIAINDVAVGWEIYRRALEKGIGTVLER